ncbi:alpha/beta hydrolase, partial (plasmid) [Rhodococcus erythropolis]
ALYAWLRDAAPFATFGAGSPGVVNADSQIHTLVEALPERGVGSVVPKLHVTLNEVELTGPIPIYRGLARNVLAVVEQLHGKGRSQDVSTAVLHETHVTGIQASFLSYLKTSHAR